MSKEDTVNTIWASVGVTKNLGNYESLRIDAGARRTLADGLSAEETDAEWNKVWEEVQAQLEERLLEAAEGLDD